jgi:DNA-nicking Smr family endonuclease
MALRSNDPRATLAAIRQTLSQRQAENAERERAERLAAAERERDARTFRSAVEGATPMIPAARVIKRPAVAVPRPRPRVEDAAPGATAGLSDGVDGPAAADPAEPLRFARDGIGSQTLRKLRNGEWPAQGHLDLHGLTREAARDAIASFLQKAGARGWRCIRIVHGKGLGSGSSSPVLKTLTGRWLAQSPVVLAYTQARDAEGGAGALLVLLKTG